MQPSQEAVLLNARNVLNAALIEQTWQILHILKAKQVLNNK